MIKSQTATEYLVITAVVIVLALVTIGILGGIPGIGSKNSGRMSSAQLTSRDVAIVSYSVTDTGTSVVIRNNNPNVIRINNLSVNNTLCQGPTFPITMNPGQTRTVFCPNINGTAGARYNYPVSVGWSDFYNAKYIDYGEFSGRVGQGNTTPGTSGPEEPGGSESSWTKTFGGENGDYGHSALATSDGGYIILGSTFSFGAGRRDVWLIKTDSGGNEEWNKTFGGTGEDMGSSIAITSDGGYIITGYTDSFNDGESGVLLIKTDSLGNQEWQKNLRNGTSLC
jgi:hypothetical protein